MRPSIAFHNPVSSGVLHRRINSFSTGNPQAYPQQSREGNAKVACVMQRGGQMSASFRACTSRVMAADWSSWVWTLFTAYITVEWSRPLKKAPISGKE